MSNLSKEFKNFSSFHCPYCNVSVLPGEFLYHCTAFHAFKDYDKCVWCLRLPHDTHSDVWCFRNFMRRVSSASSSSFGVASLSPRRWLSPDLERSSDDPFEILPPLDVVPLRHEGLRLAATIVRLYARTRETSDWYCAMTVDQNFGKRTTITRNHVVFAFGCDCGTHRHGVVFQPKGSRHLQSLRKQRIDTAMHLVRTLGTLGREGSPCPFESACRGKTRTRVGRPSLPFDYEVACALQWDGGLAELVQLWYDRADLRVLAPAAASRNGLWGVRVGDLPNLPRRYALPVREDQGPVGGGGKAAAANSSYVCLTKGRTLFFSTIPELASLDSESWRVWQIDHGNSIFEHVADEIYYPTPQVQECLNVRREALENSQNDLTIAFPDNEIEL